MDILRRIRDGVCLAAIWGSMANAESPAPPTPANPTDATDFAQRFEQLQQRLDRLETENVQLRQSLPPTPEAVVPASAEAFNSNLYPMPATPAPTSQPAFSDWGISWKNGVWFESKDKAFKLHVGGRTQIDGGWQVAARYSRIDLKDGGINGGVVDDFTAGFNWFLNPNTKVQWNYAIAFRNAAGNTSDGTIQEAGFRVAFDW